MWQPDYYLYFDVAADQIPERARRRGLPIDDNNVWYYQPASINTAYARYFSSIECDVPVYHVDANQSPESVVREILTFLAKANGGKNGK